MVFQINIIDLLPYLKIGSVLLEWYGNNKTVGRRKEKQQREEASALLSSSSFFLTFRFLSFSVMIIHIIAEEYDSSNVMEMH